MIETDAGAQLGEIVLKSSARAPELARKWLVGVFRSFALGDDYVARTVVTELVTNVHKHTDTELIPVRVLLAEGHLALEVEDRSNRLPVVRKESDTAESGRGLLMLSMLVPRWGVRSLPQGGKAIRAWLDG